MTKESFKDKFSFDKRKTESEKIKKKYEDRIPIIVEKEKSSKLNDIDKTKFLAPSDLTMGQFSYVIRKRIELNEAESLFLFVNNTMITGSSSISAIYNDHKDEDGFLYITYCSENVFG